MKTESKATKHEAVPKHDIVQKRITTMPDGRYLIFYTFPTIDREFRSLPPAEAANDRTSSGTKN